MQCPTGGLRIDSRNLKAGYMRNFQKKIRALAAAKPVNNSSAAGDHVARCCA
jgi:hypothetical protein